MVDIARLGLAVESSSVERATPALQRMTAAAGQAEGAAIRLGRAGGATSGAMQQVTAATQTAEREIATLAARALDTGAAFDRMGSVAVANANRVNTSIGGMRFQTAGLAAQFQDVGITAAMGMSPMLIGLQQGTQLAGQLATMTNPIKGLGTALLSLLSPVSLLSIGFTALLAVGIQWGASLLSGAKDAQRALADEAMSLDQVRGAVNSLSSITDDYARAIRGTAKDQEIATQSILANSEKEFNAKKSLLELELKRQQAAIEIQRAEITSTGAALRNEVARGTLGAGADPRSYSPYYRSAAEAALTERTRELLNNSPLNDKLKELRANLSLAEVGTAALEEALKTTFSESVADSIGRIASTAKTAGQKMAESYADIVRGARQHIAASELEASTIGMTAEQINAQTYAMKLLNQAADKGVVLTSDQTQELMRLGAQMASAEEHTRRLTEAYDGVIGALSDGLANLFDKPLADANAFFGTVLGGFVKLGQANLQAGLDDLLKGNLFSPAANDNGGWSEARAKVFGKAMGEGFGDFLKQNAGNIGAGLGGLGIGYSTQSPLMGALGGALAGASAGPIGAVIGGVAGLIGGFIGMNEQLEKARRALDDNRMSIEQFIDTGMGKEVSEISVAVARFKAQGAQLVEVAKAAGDTRLVNQLERAMDAYRGTLKAQQAADKVRDRFEDARQDLIDSYQREADVLRSVVDRTRDFITATQQFQSGLLLDKQFSTLSPQRMLEESQKQFDLILAKARLGDANAQGRLQGAATNYLDAARGYLGSSQGYQDIFERVQAGLSAAVTSAGTQLSSADRQLQVANQQLTKLDALRDAVLTIPQAVKQLEKVTAQAAQLDGKAAEKLTKEIEKLNRKIGLNDLKKKAA